MTIPSGAEAEVSAVVANAFAAILAAFEAECINPPTALTKLLDRTQAGITKELGGLIGTWRPATTAAGKVRRGVGPAAAAKSATKPVKSRINIMRSRAKKFSLIPCGNANIDLELELLTETITDNIADLFKGWRS